jgi:WD40 repeat protein
VSQFLTPQAYTIQIWDIENEKLNKTIYGLPSQPLSMAVLSNGYLAIGLTDGGIMQFDVENDIFIRTLNGHVSYVISLTLTKNDLLVSSSADGFIRLWGKCANKKHNDSC